MSMRRTLMLKLREGADPKRVAALEKAMAEAPKQMPMVLHGHLGKNITSRRYPGWHYTWDTLFPGLESVQPYMDHPYHRQVLAPFFTGGPQEKVLDAWDSIYFEPRTVGVREPGIKSCIKRSLIIAVGEGTPKKDVDAFERMLGDMVKYIPEIINWGLNRTSQVRPTPYTFTWEQEFRDLDGYRAYGAHPYHWGPLDDWFDHERPEYIVAKTTQVFYPAESTVLGWKG